MQLDSIPQMIRDSKRIQQIVATFSKYGLAPWLSNVNAGWIQRHFKSADGQQISELCTG